MRHIFTLLFLLFLLPAAAQMNLISRHQAWADSIYRDPASMTEERLVNESLSIIANNLQERSALDVVRHTATFIPELMDYCRLHESGAVDTLTRRTNNALKALADYSERRWPGSTLASRTRIFQYVSTGNVIDNNREWKEFIERQKDIVTKDFTRENRALLVMAKIIDRIQTTVRRNYDDPRDYPEFFALEKEALQVFPADDTTLSDIHSELYYYLGQLKTLPANDILAGIEQMKADWNLDMDFVYIGPNVSYPCNTNFYLERARDIAVRMLNEGHPWVMEIERSIHQFVANNLSIDDELYNKLRADYDYMRWYFPSESMEVAAARILMCLQDLQSGRTSSDELFLRSCVETLATVLGKANPLYHQHLVQIAATKLFVDPDDEFWFDKLINDMSDEELDKSSDAMSYYIIRMFTPFYAINQDLALEKIDIIYKDYLENHHATMLSVLCGRELSSFYATQLFDSQKAAMLTSIAWSDLTEVLGPQPYSSPVLWETLLSSVRQLGDADFNTAEKHHNNFLSILDGQDFPEKDFFRFHFLDNLARIRHDKLHDSKGALELYEQCLPLAKGNPGKINVLGKIAVLRQLLGNPASESEPFVKEAMALVEQTPELSMSTSSLDALADWYYNEGRFEESLNVTKKQLEIYQTIMGDAFSMEYISLRRNLADVYERLGNRNEARRILGADADMMESAFGLTPSPALLDCLWADYYVTCNDNIKDIVTISTKLSRIQQLTTRLYQTSGNDDNFYYSYMSRMLGEGLYILSVSLTEARKLTDIPESMMNQWQEMLTIQDKNLDFIAGQSEEMINGFKTYDKNYAERFEFRNLVNGLASYYTYKEDHDRSIELQKLLLKDDFDFGGLSNYINIAWSCYNHGRRDEARKYMETADKGLETLKVVNPMDYNNLLLLHLNFNVEDGDYEGALPYARDYYVREKQVLDGNFQLMTTKEQSDYMDTHGDPSNYLVSLLEYLPERIAGESYDAILYRTGMQLRSQKATKEAISRSPDPEVRLMLDSLNNLKAAHRSMGIVTTVMTQEETTERNNNLTRLQHRINRLEQQLLDATVSVRQSSVSDISWQQVRDRLKPGEAALEFAFSHRHVLALLIRPGFDAPHVIRLAECDSLMNHIRSFRTKSSVALAARLYRKGDTRLYDMLWRGLEPELQNVTTVYHTAPGILSQLAFNAFATPDGATLFDRYDMVQLTTTGQLVFDHPDTRLESIAMMGDILYDRDQVPVAPKDGVRALDSEDLDFIEGMDIELSLDGLRGPAFTFLPYTGPEIDAIAELFPAKGVSTSRRHDATEARLRQLADSHPDVLHLATHGYYITPDVDLTSKPFFTKKGFGTMQRSGIALADAEAAWRGESTADEENDGIMTAAEIAELDLNSTKLVTLSACETALGDFNFEGIFGLQRGLKQAGAGSLLVSLWNVKDASTMLFMKTFYGSLRDRQNPRAAWRRAVAAVRDKYKIPLFWAPFILLD